MATSTAWVTATCMIYICRYTFAAMVQYLIGLLGLQAQLEHKETFTPPTDMDGNAEVTNMPNTSAKCFRHRAHVCVCVCICVPTIGSGISMPCRSSYSERPLTDAPELQVYQQWASKFLVPSVGTEVMHWLATSLYISLTGRHLTVIIWPIQH